MDLHYEVSAIMGLLLSHRGPSVTSDKVTLQAQNSAFWCIMGQNFWHSYLITVISSDYVKQA